MKIAVGTVSKQKIRYLKDKVSEQPKTTKETRLGSKNRARAALDKNPEADFAIGIEIGYYQNKTGKYEMFCCTSIIDQHRFFETCSSSKFLLPKFHQDILKADKYLGKYVKEYKKDADRPTTNYIRELITDRKPLIIEATRNALLRYLNKGDFS